MGNIPSPNDILNNQIPTLDDYPKALDIVNTRLLKLYKDNKIYGAATYGSSINNEIRIGSDIDLFIISDNISNCMQELQELRGEIWERYIDLEINPLISIRQAKSGQHGIQGGFFEYLKYSILKNEVIGDSLFDILSSPVNDISTANEFINYRKEGLRRMTKDCTYPMYSASIVNLFQEC